MARPIQKSPHGRRTAWDPKLYDRRHSFVWELGAEVVALLDPQPEERILDLGCGTGHLTARISKSGARVVGVDSSEEMVRAAHTAYPNIDFRVADARALEFGAEFDAVFSNAALHWIRPPESVIDSVWTALRSGGRFVGECGGKGNIQRFREAFVAARSDLRIEGNLPDPWYFPSVSEYATLLENRGFEVRFMRLFDRPTMLEEGSSGLRIWIATFAADFCSQINPDQQERFLRNVEDRLRPEMFRNGRWLGDYRRLRFAAWK